MVSSSAVEMRIALTLFQLFKMKKQKRHKSDSSDSPLSKGPENCCKQKNEWKIRGWWMVCCLTRGTESCRRGIFCVIFGPHTHTPTSLRGRVGLADLLCGLAVPDTPLPAHFGMPPAPGTVWYTLGVAAKVCHEGGRVWPLLWGWHFWEVQATPTKGLHPFRLPRAMRLCTDQITAA